MTANAIVTIGADLANPVRFGNRLPLALIAGPCQMESRDHALEMALALKEIGDRLGIGLVFKTSFDKANRTSAKGQRGMGLEAALPVFAEIRERTGLPVLTDVHDASPVRRGRAGRRCLADPRLPLPPDRSAARRGRDRPRRQRQEGPVPGALGHGQRRREGDREPATRT